MKLKNLNIHAIRYLPYQERQGNIYTNCQRWFWAFFKQKLKIQEEN